MTESSDPTEDAPAEAPVAGAAVEQPQSREAKAAARAAEKAARAAAAAERASERARLAAEERDQRASTAAAEPATSGHAGRRGALVVTMIIALVLAVGFATAWIVELSSSGNLHDKVRAAQNLDAERTAVLAASKTYAIDLGTIDYSNLNGYLAKNKANLTPGFYSEFEQFASGLGDKISQIKATVTGSVDGEGISSISTDKATVLVFLVQTFKVSGSTTTNVDRNPAIFSLVRQDGKWLISTFSFP